MGRPVVGIIGSFHLINEQYAAHIGGRMVSEAVAQVSGATPLIIPADPSIVDVAELAEACDGFVFTGARASCVQPHTRTV